MPSYPISNFDIAGVVVFGSALEPIAELEAIRQERPSGRWKFQA
jgi:hypothetical protein